MCWVDSSLGMGVPSCRVLAQAHTGSLSSRDLSLVCCQDPPTCPGGQRSPGANLTMRLPQYPLNSGSISLALNSLPHELGRYRTSQAMGVGEKNLEAAQGRETELEPLLSGTGKSPGVLRTLTHQTAKGVADRGGRDTPLGVHPLLAPPAPTLLN